MDRERLDQLRAAIIEGPVATLADLRREADVSIDVLMPGYPSEIGAGVAEQIADGAAELLGVEQGAMTAWLLEGEDVPWLQEYIEWLPTQAACTRCGEWFTKGDAAFEERLRNCRPCIRAVQNPKAERFTGLLRARLPEIHAVYPKLGAAVETAIGDPRSAVTYERLARHAGSTAAEVAAILKGMGLDKRRIGGFVVFCASLLIGSLGHAALPPISRSPTKVLVGLGRRRRMAEARAQARQRREHRGFRLRLRLPSNREADVGCAGLHPPKDDQAEQGAARVVCEVMAERARRGGMRAALALLAAGWSAEEAGVLQ